MKEIRDFLKTSLLGGALVLLPVALLIVVTRWLFNVILNAIQPLTNLLVTTSHFREVSAALLVMLVLLVGCFLVGFLVRTQLGSYVYGAIDSWITKNIPGYSLIKETIMQLMGGKKSPFSQVALVRLYESDVLTTAFVTDHHENGSYTVFVPTAPNPTSGLIFHLKPERVTLLDASVEATMRSIISCGVGSAKIIAAEKPKILK